MKRNELSQPFPRPVAQGRARKRRPGPVFTTILCLVGVAACAERSDPLQQAFDAAGGQEALQELTAFSYTATGDRFEPGQSVTPDAGALRSSSFDLAVQYDAEGDRLTYDWQREIYDPARGALAYQEVIDGDSGYQMGNFSVFNPPDADLSRALPSEHIAAVRREFRLLNPILYLRDAALSDGTATILADVERDGRTYRVLEVADPAYPAELLIDPESGLVAALRTLQNDHIWGDLETEVSFEDWSPAEGGTLLFPRRVVVTLAGETLHTEERTDVVLNPDLAAAAFALPEEPRTEVDEAAALGGARSAQYHTRWHALGIPADANQVVVTATPVGGDPYVQHLTGGTHHSLAIKLGDGVVVIEPPLNEARSQAVLAKVEELWPGVPVSYLVLTHHHYDHMGGIRTYAARGATILTSALNREYVEEALSSPHTLVVDELAAVESPTWAIEAVPADEELTLEAGGRTLKLRHVPTVHSEDLLVAYVPENKLLFVSDVYIPVFPPGQPIPEPFGTWSQGLWEQLPTFDWDVEWIVGGHGGIVSIADFNSHFES